MTASPGSPVVILGIAQRSGTNFLRDLLVLHPDLEPVRVAEDFFVSYSDDLERYAARVSKRWLPEWGSRDEILRALGAGLAARFTAGTAPRRPLFKTPSVANLRNVFDLFPDARVLVIVRDGRAVAESSEQSFGMNSEEIARRWSSAAASIVGFERECRKSGWPLRIVRYENLVANARGELAGILDFLGLDPKKYDFDGAVNLPVRGSGTKKNAEGKVHWQQVEKKGDFKPLERFASWPPARHDRYNWLAADGMRALGYEMRPVSVPAWRWRLTNRWTDFRQLPFRRLRRIARAIVNAWKEPL